MENIKILNYLTNLDREKRSGTSNHLSSRMLKPYQDLCKNAAEGLYLNEDKTDFITATVEFARMFKPEIADTAEDELIAFIGETAALPERRKETIFKMNARNYWNIIGRDKYPALYKIAKPINEMICSSATAERAWSTF